MLIGFQARNHPQQVARRGADDSVDERITPHWLFRQAHYEFGFTCDAAANEANAKLPAYFDLESDGLLQSWAGHRVWCNPPFSDLPSWVRKASIEVGSGCELVVMLLPANRTEQPWWQDYIEPHRDGRGPIETRFIRSRFNFGEPTGEPRRFRTSAPFGCVFVIWRAAESR